MKSNGGEDGSQASLSGWTGIHLIIGAFLTIRGFDVSSEALRQAAQATHPLVEGRLPNAVVVLGTYGGIIAELLDGDDDDGQGQVRETGHTDRPGEENDSDRSDTSGMGDFINRGDTDSGNVPVDGSDLTWDI